MQTHMNDDNLGSPAAIRAFLDGTNNTEILIAKKEQYSWLAKVLKQSAYFSCSKKDKGTVRAYMLKMTGYSRQHLTRLLAQYRKYNCLSSKSTTRSRNKFKKIYTREDILLLAATDEHHATLSGAMTKKLFDRAYTISDDQAYERLAKISVSHIYNLRRNITYTRKRVILKKTKGNGCKIGQRKRPLPDNKPGYIRVDTVHQGDKDGQKGVYHINAVDEVTQYLIVTTVAKIDQSCVIPALESIIARFPFKIINFHTDNGSEYINHQVANLLNVQNISLTKSRSQRSNDNALAESKNCSIVRKHLGYYHIPQEWAEKVNEFNRDYLNPYVNFHRPCYFPEITIAKNGKQKKQYPYKYMMTPFDKLKSLPNAEQCLKPGITLAKLEEEALKQTDLDSVKSMNTARKKLFAEIFTD